MNDRFKFRAGFTVPYTDDNGNDRDIQLFIKGYFSVDCGGAGIVVHSSIIDEALNNTNLSLNEKKSVVKYLEANYCENDEYWLIDNLDFLEQCTGQKDKNGQLIYEGDILDFDLSNPRNGGHYRGFVCWERHNELIGWMISDMEQIGAWDLRQIAHPNDWMVWGEIIGNIHENSELVK